MLKDCKGFFNCLSNQFPMLKVSKKMIHASSFDASFQDSLEQGHVLTLVYIGYYYLTKKPCQLNTQNNSISLFIT